MADIETIDFRKIYEDVYGDFCYTRDFEMDPGKTALVIVDVQPAFTDPSVGYMKAYAKLLKASVDYFADRVNDLVIPNTNKLLDFFRQNNMMVVYIVTFSETEDLSDMDRNHQKAIRKFEQSYGEQVWRKWNPGMNVREEIAPRPGELVLPKRTGSAFASSILPYVLRNAGIETVVLTGCNTNGCVFETSCVGCNMGFEIILANDATACFAQTLQDMAEKWISHFFGMVRTTDETIEIFKDKIKGNSSQ